MRNVLLLLTLLAFGCDDTEVEARTLDILANGAARAHIQCALTLEPAWGSPNPGSFQATRMQDGSCLSVAALGNIQTGASFAPRSVAAADDCDVLVSPGVGALHFSVAEGDVTVLYEHETEPNDTEYFAVDTYCTGFNLEAFGVE